MIKKMLNVNGRISRDVSRDDNAWLRRPEFESWKSV